MEGHTEEGGYKGPQNAGEFSNIFNISLKKMLDIHYFWEFLGSYKTMQRKFGTQYITIETLEI